MMTRITYNFHNLSISDACNQLRLKIPNQPSDGALRRPFTNSTRSQREAIRLRQIKKKLKRIY